MSDQDRHHALIRPGSGGFFDDQAPDAPPPVSEGARPAEPPASDVQMDWNGFFAGIGQGLLMIAAVVIGVPLALIGLLVVLAGLLLSSL